MIMVLDGVSVERYQNSFKLYDSNGDGLITAAELQRALNIMGIKPSQREIKDIITEFDRDRDKAINRDEFMVMMIHKYHQDDVRDDPETQRKVFEIFDSDGDGRIDKEQFKLLCRAVDRTLPEALFEPAFRGVCRDDCTDVCFRRFRSALLKMRNTRRTIKGKKKR